MRARGHGWKWLEMAGPRSAARDIAGALSPEDNDAPEVGWFTTSLRRIDLDTFHHERNAA
jgi:hypothetical protein